MSLRKSWTLRTGLTLGAAALAFGLGSGPSIAAGHEGHGGSMAGMRGGGDGGAGEVRSLNERFGSMRIETLSSAGLAHPPAGLAHPTFRPSSLPGAHTSHSIPSATGPRRIVEPRVIPNSAPAQSPSEPSADVQRPTTDVRGPVVDPVRPAMDVQRPTTDVRGPVLDPVRPAVDVNRPSPNTDHVILVEPKRQQNPPSPDAF